MSDEMFKMGSIDSLIKSAESLEGNKSKSYKDDRFWKLDRDKTGNGYAVIRFLPPTKGEHEPWARYWSHAFQGPGGWYIENSRTTLNEKDPVSEMNSQLWHSGLEKDKELARKYKRKLNIVSNIFVVHDPANPQNEGKVFLFRYGKKIFDKITEAMKPAFADEKPINPFHFLEGANFKVKIRTIDGFPNYDSSEFAAPSPMCNGDESEIKKIWESQYPLREFTDPSNFKSYDELKSRLTLVLGNDVRRSADAPSAPTAESYSPTDESSAESSPFTPTNTSEQTNSGFSDDASSYFERLAAED